MHLIKVLHAFYRCLKKRNDKEFMDYVLKERHGEPINININYDAAMREQKRVLICYLPINEYKDIDVEQMSHTNKIERYQIIRSFIKKGYCVDICHCLDRKAILKLADVHYDVIFGFGHTYRAAYTQWPDAKHIIYFTESPYWYSKQQETERLQMFRERTGIEKAMKRTGTWYEEDDENKADVIVCMCEEKLFVKTGKPVYRIAPYGFKSNIIDENLFAERNENHFLVFGIFGYVHKGVDLLIDVVKKHPDWHLHICGDPAELDEDGYDYIYPNIHMEGYIHVNDVRYKELVQKCMFVILASCSEGMPTGVITGMRHGLIPVVSSNIGMEYCGEEKAVFFDELSERGIEKTLERCTKADRTVLQNMSHSIYEYANDEFSIQAFTKRMDSCLDDILSLN